jgi:hypothetical protein
MTQKTNPISHQGRRLVDAANQPLELLCQPASLGLREKAAQLALPSVRFDRQPARMQARYGAAEFNLRPMPREHVLNGMMSIAELYADVRIRNCNRLAVMTSRHARSQRPSQERHFEAREGHDGPETLAGHEAGNGKRDEADAAEEQKCGANAERTVWADLDAFLL